MINGIKMGNKGIGYWVAVAALILTLVATILYWGDTRATDVSRTLLVITLVVGVVLLLAELFFDAHWMNLGLIVCAVLLIIGLVSSAGSQVNQIGYVVSGLDPFSTIASYVVSMIVGAVALIGFLAANFLGMEKE